MEETIKLVENAITAAKFDVEYHGKKLEEAKKKLQELENEAKVLNSTFGKFPKSE